MLVLARKKLEVIHIGDNIVVKVLNVRNGVVRIGIEAPASVRVLRGELTGNSTHRVELATSSLESQFDALVETSTVNGVSGEAEVVKVDLAPESLSAAMSPAEGECCGRDGTESLDTNRSVSGAIEDVSSDLSIQQALNESAMYLPPVLGPLSGFVRNRINGHDAPPPKLRLKPATRN